jgi:hypothetical protein
MRGMMGTVERAEWAPSRIGALLGFVLLLVVPTSAGGRPLREPIEVRIEGYLGASEEQTHPWAMLDVWLAEPPGRKFALMNIIVLSPGAASGGDILAAMQPVRPNIIFNGTPEQLEQIGSARPNQLLKIVGYTADGPRRILVSRVEVGPPVTGPTATPTLGQKLFGF